uniref:C-type lectin domain-containing protein n=1 Tax=Astatotilapia calliptera TaxID=8154 RepID=A0AAX7U0V2_ASTCA
MNCQNCSYKLFPVSLSACFSKYVYIDQKMDWLEAQKYCQQHYTDLAPVSNERDNNELQQLASNVNENIWIGLVRNSSDRTEWLWSGGGAPTISLLKVCTYIILRCFLVILKRQFMLENCPMGLN